MRQWSLVVLVLLLATAVHALEGPVIIDQGRPRLAARVNTFAPAADPNDAVLTYDSGPVYFFPDATTIGTLWGVRFSPVQACSLMSVDVFAYQGSGQIRFRFYRDDNGQPGAEFGTPQIRTLIGDLNLETVVLDPLDVGASDFYVMMEIISGPPPYPVTDADGGSGRSWFRFPGQDWEHVVDFDISLRAGVRYYGVDLTGPEIIHIPVTRSFSDEFSTPIRCRFTDLSGISYARVFYRAQGAATWDSSNFIYQFDSEWQAEVPLTTAGTTIEYFIRAYDASTTHNQSTLPQGAPDVVFTYYMHPGRELVYDDGSPEMFFYIDTVWANNLFAVRMTPPTYPVKVNLLRAFVSDTSPFDFEIHAAAGGQLAGLLAGPFQVSAPEAFRWADFVIPDAQQPLIASGDFFVVFRWKPNSPTLPAVGADSVVGASGRSYSDDDIGGWFNYTMFDWQIRSAIATPTAVIEIGGPNVPRTFELGQNFPNPFNPRTRVEFALSQPSHVRLSVYNLLGQHVVTLVDEHMPAGRYQADFEGRNQWGDEVPSGVYFYRLDTDEFSQTRKMMLLR
jgi:hypothetical protein